MVKEAKQPKRVHPCPHCLTGFRSPSERDRHARAVHEKWRDYKCPHCSSLFELRSARFITQQRSTTAASPPLEVKPKNGRRQPPHRSFFVRRPRQQYNLNGPNGKAPGRPLAIV